MEVKPLVQLHLAGWRTRPDGPNHQALFRSLALSLFRSLALSLSRSFVLSLSRSLALSFSWSLRSPPSRAFASFRALTGRD